GLDAFRLAPGRNRRTTARCLAFTTTQRVIDRVHGDATNLRTLTAPAIRAGLADDLQLMVGIADFADGRHALFANHAYFRRRHAQRDVIAFLGDDLRTVPGAADDLAALARPQFDVVHRRTERHFTERYCVARTNVGAR